MESVIVLALLADFLYSVKKCDRDVIMNLKLKKMLAAAAASAAFLAAVQCSDKPVPVTQLNDARLELSKAESEGADKTAAELYKKADQLLLDSHTKLAENDRDASAEQAVMSYESSVKARLLAAPVYTDEKKAAAQTSLENAEKAMAESFAAAEYNQALTLFNEAAASHDNAAKLKAGLPAEPASAEGEAKPSEPEAMAKKQEVLSAYEAAYTKYNNVQMTANAARTRSLARSSELTASANRTEAKLREAQSMGAQQSSPDAYNKAMADLNLAKSKIASGDLKEASELLRNAEQLANTAHAAAQQSQARKLADQAKTSLDGAKRSVAQKKASSPATEENNSIFAKLDEFLKAGDEGLNSSETNYRNRRYDASIKDSNEVINLTKIISAELAKVSATDPAAVAARERQMAAEQAEKDRLAKEQAEKDRLAAEQAKKDSDDSKKASDLPEGWSEYTVKAPNSLWRIAKYPEIYGRGIHWKKIYEANKEQIKNPDRIYPGQVLKIPPKDWNPEKK